MTKYGPGRVSGWVPGIALPTPPSRPIPRVHLPPPHSALATGAAQYPGLNSAVGLISVEQLTLGTHFSGSRGMTEVYNLVEVGNPDDHIYIPGTD